MGGYVVDNLISLDDLKKYLDYNQDTGIFTWKITKSNSNKAGNISNSHTKAGYIQIRIDKKLYLGHRLAWFYVYGEWPELIDHINGIKDDNRISNLRKATKQQNLMNSKMRSNNKTGAKGVIFCKDRNRYRAEIGLNGKNINLGYFKDFDLAELVADEARRKYFGEFYRG